jgi:hypothetical protein
LTPPAGAKANRYFVCLPTAHREPRAWDPLDPGDVPIPDCRYLGGVFTEFERLASDAGLTVYVTWDVSWLPAYGPDVVAVVLGDEWCRVPLYAHRVRAVFKNYGVARLIEWRPRFDGLWFSQMLQETRIGIERLPFVATAMLGTLAGRRARIYDMPLGYFKQIALPIVPIRERRYDAFFAGSIEHQAESSFLRGLTRAPKIISRERMFAALEAYRDAKPQRAIELRTTADFQASVSEDGDRYSHSLAQTKVCVVPRGASPETFRWFEGLRYGCVIVCEALPHRRYYTGAPVLTIERWEELPALLERVLSDPDELERLHRASLRWWFERCSEAVSGAFIAEHLEA